MNFHEIFVSCLSPEIFLDSENITKTFGLETVSFEVPERQVLEDRFLEVKNHFYMLTQEIEVSISQIGVQDRNRIYDSILLQTAPFASIFGVALSGLSAPSNFEDRVSLGLMKLHADDVGVGKIAASRRALKGFRKSCDTFKISRPGKGALDISKFRYDRWT